MCLSQQAIGLDTMDRVLDLGGMLEVKLLFTCASQNPTVCFGD